MSSETFAPKSEIEPPSGTRGRTFFVLHLAPSKAAAWLPHPKTVFAVCHDKHEDTRPDLPVRALPAQAGRTQTGSTRSARQVRRLKPARSSSEEIRDNRRFSLAFITPRHGSVLAESQAKVKSGIEKSRQHTVYSIQGDGRERREKGRRRPKIVYSRISFWVVVPVSVSSLSR
jgi:hypothetical protein